MKDIIVVRAALVLISLLLTACGGVSMEKRPDGTYLGMTTVWHIDRSASEIAQFTEDGVNPDGSPKFKEVKKVIVTKKQDGSIVTEEVSNSSLSVGPTVAGQATVAAVGGFTTAATQGFLSIAAAKEASKACKNGKCSDNGNKFYIQGGSAGAFSESGASAGVALDANIGTGARCTGACLAH